MATEIIMPALEMAQDSAILVRWLKAPNDWVEQGEAVMEIETDKATVEVEASAAGVLVDIRAAEGDVVPVGQVVALLIGRHEEHSHGAFAGSSQSERATSGNADNEPDVGAHDGDDSKRTDPGTQRSGPRTLPVADGVAHLRSGNGSYTVATLTAARRRAGERLQASHRDVPAFAVSRTVDMTEPLKDVASHRADGRHVSLTALLAFAVACTLRDHRDLNAHIVDGELRLHDDINLGIAVGLPDGLVVPVLRGADKLTQVELAGRLDHLVDAARSGHLSDGQMGGATFTISNLGMLGVDEFTAIINPPEVAILAVGSLRQLPMVLDGQICIRDQLTLTLVSDHRAVDGVTAARFLDDLSQRISTGQTRRGQYETTNPSQSDH